VTSKPLTSEQRDDFNERKSTLLRAVEDHDMNVFEATKAFRKLLGMSQAEYGKKVVGLSRNQVAAIEKGQANPTFKTLQTIGRPFGFDVGFVRRKKPVSPNSKGTQ